MQSIQHHDNAPQFFVAAASLTEVVDQRPQLGSSFCFAWYSKPILWRNQRKITETDWRPTNVKDQREGSILIWEDPVPGWKEEPSV